MKLMMYAQTLQTIQHRLLNDPLLALTYALAWLDPLIIEEDALDDEWAADLTYAARVCRRCFPGIYVELLQQARAGLPTMRLEAFVCTTISDRMGVEVAGVEMLHYGPPLEALGLPLGHPEFFTGDHFARERAALALLGVTASYHEAAAAFHRAGRIGDVLARSLEAYDQALAWLLRWLLSLSGNTLVDYSAEELWEGGFEPLAWTLEDVRFHREMHTEAVQIVTAAQGALDRLLSDTSLQTGFVRNSSIIAQQLERNPHHDPDTLAARLRWTHQPPDPAGGPTPTHLDVL